MKSVHPSALRRLLRLLALLPFLLGACTEIPTLPATLNQISLAADGKVQIIQTKATNVQELLTETHLSLGALDRVEPPETAKLENGMHITVTRVIQEIETITQTVSFQRRTVRDASVPEGETRLLSAGRAGIRQQVYRITKEDGVITERVQVRDELTTPPEDEVLLLGTRPQIDTLPITGTLSYLDHQDAWIMRESSRNPRRLTSFGDLDGQIFTLSPDGYYLLFTRAVTEEEHLNELWIMDTIQADAQAMPLNVDDVLWVGWSPDGEQIAWTTAEWSERAPGWRGRNDLWIARLADGKQLTSRRRVLEPEAGGGYGWWGTRYSWAPNGTRLAYSTPEEVGTVDFKTGKRLSLITFPAYRTYSSWAWNPEIAWTPDSNFIALTVHRTSATVSNVEESPIFNLWMLEATGAYSAELSTEVGMWATPRFSPDGNRLLFGHARVPYQSQSSAYTLCTQDRDGSNRTCFFPPEDEVGLELPAWNWVPESEAVIFILQGDLYLLPLGTNQAIPLTDGGRITAFNWP